MIITIDNLFVFFKEVCPSRSSETAANWQCRVARAFGLSVSRVRSLIYDKRSRLHADEVEIIQLRVLRHRNTDVMCVAGKINQHKSQLQNDKNQEMGALLHEIRELREAFISFSEDMQGVHRRHYFKD